jgi:hypothetical protein
MTFNELQFHSHPAFPGAVEALTFFPNGYGAAITGKFPFKGDGINTFEIHGLIGTEDDFTYDCTAYPALTKQEVTNILTTIYEARPRFEENDRRWS